MPISFVTAETGGGKGVYSMMEIEKYLRQGRRVATNMDLFFEHFDDDLKDATVTRLPDKPTRQHMLDLGWGSDPNDKNKHNYGLIVLDEISLFLDLKTSAEFKGLYNWFKQRRKFHWDIIFIAQHKDQVQDEFFKALCNNLIVCQERDLIPIPYLGPLLRGLGLSGNMSDGHFYAKYLGKSEMDRLIETGKYENIPYRKKYDTDQFFDDGIELVGDDFLDMRATYTYLPKSYLVKPAEQEQTDMARPDYFQSSALKIKGAFLIVAILVAVYMLFFRGTPTDDVIKKPKAQTSQTSALKPFDTKRPKPEQPDLDFAEYLFENFTPRLTSVVSTETQTLAKIDFIDHQSMQVHQTMTIQDFKLLGYRTMRTQNGFLIIKGDNKYIVSRSLSPFEEKFNKRHVSNNGH